MSFCSLASSDIQLLLSEAPLIEYQGQSYSRLQIVSAAYRLSQQLPDASNIINLHSLRHEFIVVLLAAAFKGASAVLPPNTAKNTLLALVESAPKTFISTCDTLYSKLVDQRVPTIDFLSLLNDSIIDQNLLKTKLETLSNSVIQIYTSGTTGRPKQVTKSWYSMSKMAHRAIERFHLNSDNTIVATVPSQHMFGLETTVFWPLFSAVRLYSDKPLFSADMMDVFEGTDNDIFLVSTPLHLKNWVDSQELWPNRKLSVLSATAPMDKELAEKVTTQWQARLFEVLGSTETASFAPREIMLSELWEPYQNTNIQLSGSNYEVYFKDLGEFYPLQDDIQMEVGGRFKLLGRQSDMIKVAGKRASLCELNRVLLSIDGVRDGVFLNLGKERLSAVVASDLSIKDIKQCLNESMDPVFLPRPIYFVDRLPRNELGKLQMSQLLEEIDGQHND